MIRNIEFSDGEFYHIYNRGVNKDLIFKDKNDYRRFVVLLFLCNSEEVILTKSVMKSSKDPFDFDRKGKLVSIGSYCLMPNHFHILLKQEKDNGITKFMRKLSTGYSMYFNKKNDRTGHVFEGSFKAKNVVFDEYLKYLFAYINLNPVKLIDKNWKEEGIRDMKRAKEHLKGYGYSSYIDLARVERKEGIILDLAEFPGYFSEENTFESYLKEWLEFEKNIIPHNTQIQGPTLDKEG